MPGETGATVVTTLVWFSFFPREAAGASSARHSPRPLRGEGCLHDSGATRRGNVNAYLDVSTIAFWLFENQIRASGASATGAADARVPDAVQRPSRCSAEPGPTRARYSLGPGSAAQHFMPRCVRGTRATAPSPPGSAETRPARRTCSRTTRARSVAAAVHKGRAPRRAPS
jgi:hypothetical protein